MSVPLLLLLLGCSTASGYMQSRCLHRPPGISSYASASAPVSASAATTPPLSTSRRRAVTLLGGGLGSLGLGSRQATAAKLEPEVLPSAAAPGAGRGFLEVILPPVTNRATVRYELGRGMWAFEQLLTFTNVSATVRMNVVRMKDGGLICFAPVAPTGECLQLLRELGEVRHIVLPVTALEHKAFTGPFVRQFPLASVWVAPGQYGPFGAVGLSADTSSLPYRISGVLGEGEPPWASEFDYKTLYIDLPENSGPVAEIAFLHKPTSTLLVTDAVIFVPPAPPPIFETYFSPSEVSNADFWPKTVLQAVFLTLRQDADGSWPSFQELQGKLVRAPILRAFADVRAPVAVRDWVRSVGSWDFDRIVTSHFSSPIVTTPAEWEAAFGFLEGRGKGNLQFQEADWALLDGLNDFIAQNKLGAPVLADYK